MSPTDSPPTAARVCLAQRVGRGAVEGSWRCCNTFFTASTILHYCSKYVLILYATEKSILILLPSVKYIEGQRTHVQVKYVCLETMTALLSFSKVAFLGIPDLYTSHYKSYCSLVCELVHEHFCYYV